MTTHIQARAFAAEALGSDSQTSGEVKVLAGIACLETSYGDGWKGSGRGSNNMGAEQCGSLWKGDRFIYVDTHPNPDGTSTKYRAEFRKYPTPQSGWNALAPIVYVNRGRYRVRSAARANDFFGVSSALHLTSYYEGFGKTVAARIAFHHRALSRAIAAADNAAAPKVTVHELPPTLRRGARDIVRGGPVWLLQTELQLAADGAFGSITLAALLGYQTRAGIKADGICGPKTWEALFSDEYVPAAA